MKVGGIRFVAYASLFRRFSPLASLPWRNQSPMLTVGREKAVEPRQVHAQLGNERRESRDEIQWFEEHMGGTIPVRGLEQGRPGS